MPPARVPLLVRVGEPSRRSRNGPFLDSGTPGHPLSRRLGWHGAWSLDRRSRYRGLQRSDFRRHQDRRINSMKSNPKGQTSPCVRAGSRSSWRRRPWLLKGGPLRATTGTGTTNVISLTLRSKDRRSGCTKMKKGKATPCTIPLCVSLAPRLASVADRRQSLLVSASSWSSLC